MSKNRGHGFFIFAMIIKGIDGLLELVGGVLLLTSKHDIVNTVLRFLTEHDLPGDEGDKVAHVVRTGVQHLSSHTSVFASVYLLAHGAIKLFLVVGLLRGKRSVYPVALWVLAVFAAYQGYRIVVDRSIAMIALTVFDLIVIALIWHESRNQTQHHARSHRASD